MSNGVLITETIDRLFLELSQFTQAKTEKELALEREVERLKGIVVALENGCYTCSHSKRVDELTCQKNALQQVVSERDEKITSLHARLRQGTEYVDSLVDKFLAWPLPESVCADLCATTHGALHRCGTNLLTATEAKQMLEYLLGAQPV